MLWPCMKSKIFFWKNILAHTFEISKIVKMPIWKMDMPNIHNESRISKMEKKRDFQYVLTKTKFENSNLRDLCSTFLIPAVYLSIHDLGLFDIFSLKIFKILLSLEFEKVSKKAFFWKNLTCLSQGFLMNFQLIFMTFGAPKWALKCIF